MTATTPFTPGTRLTSTACSAQVIIVRPPQAPVQITCGGEPMTVLAGSEPRPLTEPAGGAPGILVGKRYFDETSGLELLCTQAGAGPLAVNGREIGLKESKPLPSSD
jgi:hypothetical protein